jgi:hypothetical protein
MSAITRLLALAALLATVRLAPAAVPSAINYQGRITNTAGVPQTGVKAMSLKIYNAATAGILLYSESVGNVTIDANGVYGFQFGASGAGTPPSISTALAASVEQWLELMVDGVAQTPRQKILAVPFALLASALPDSAVSSSMIADGAVKHEDLSPALAASLAAGVASPSATDITTALGYTPANATSLAGTSGEGITPSTRAAFLNALGVTTAGIALLNAADGPAQRALLAPSYSSWTRAAKVAMLGDSLTGLDGYHSVSNRKFYHTWHNWLNIYLGQRITWAYNPATNSYSFGVGGNRAEQILARVPDVLATDADTILVMAGANNILSDTPAILAPKVIAIWDAIIAGGKQVMATEILPLMDSNKNKYVSPTNSLLKVAAEQRGIPFVVWGKEVRDGPYARADLFFNGGLTDIGVHPGIFGGPVIGRIAAEQLDPYIQPAPFQFPAAGLVTAGGSWVTRNASMSGGSSSTAPTDWYARNFDSAGAGALSTVAWAASGGSGELTQNWFKVVIPPGPLTGGTNIQTSQNPGASGLVAGDWVQPVGRITLDQNSHFSRFNFNAFFQGDSGTVSSYALYDGTGTTGILTETVHEGRITGIVVGPKVQVTASSLNGSIYCTLSVYGYGTAMVSQMGVIKTTAP